MNADDAAALFQLEEQLKSKPSMHAPVVSWLVRCVKELDARVQELEQGGVPAVVAQKDAELSKRDVEVAKLNERLSQFEKDHLPDPGEYYRSIEDAKEQPKPKDDAPTPVPDSPSPVESTPVNVATPSDSSKDDVKQHPVTPHPGRGQQT